MVFFCTKPPAGEESDEGEPIGSNVVTHCSVFGVQSEAVCDGPTLRVCYEPRASSGESPPVLIRPGNIGPSSPSIIHRLRSRCRIRLG